MTWCSVGAGTMWSSSRATRSKSSRRDKADEERQMELYGQNIGSRLLIGTALYPSPATMEEAIRASGAEIVTVSVRREAGGGKAGDAFWKIISSLGIKVLPNTAGCRTVRDAVTTAQMARELFGTPWIKLEV